MAPTNVKHERQRYYDVFYNHNEASSLEPAQVPRQNRRQADAFSCSSASNENEASPSELAQVPKQNRRRANTFSCPSTSNENERRAERTSSGGPLRTVELAPRKQNHDQERQEFEKRKAAKALFLQHMDEQARIIRRSDNSTARRRSKADRNTYCNAHPGWVEEESESTDANTSTSPEVCSWVSTPELSSEMIGLFSSVLTDNVKTRDGLRKASCLNRACEQLYPVPDQTPFPFGATGKTRPVWIYPPGAKGLRWNPKKERICARPLVSSMKQVEPVV
ncbi:uncharacterized protein K452DRAFT_307109 [Aplosporella prunicola CBS 121167]|uniref:Uncharacterized protein n=1 Tax=Aplosporella prunicola CBS 121167 TaxID=1176127 RepID=A0A6A6BK22_9PEZI|nr:uncharacterized protein K452DRAFT_307109 [Aplosporella prunicola CBS 121167]KAF2143733.1 hypothetical protein K452DRAFT_307109 [Aplosporella prunicola CBS 121167]